MAKIKIISYLLIVFSLIGFTFATTGINYQEEPVYVGTNFFMNTCSSESGISTYANCDYYCSFCEPYNGSGACTLSGTCC
jgi:hypothetical protein